MDEATRNRLEQLVDGGADIAGGVAGSAVGLLLAGPVGALAGGALSPIITRAFQSVGSELTDRLLEQRESMRVGGTYAVAVIRVSERLGAGDKRRQDAFFDPSEEHRSAAEEILEGVLLAAQREHEERKCRHLGLLFANLVFREDVTPGMANYLIHRAESLTYRQLSLLALIAAPQRYGFNIAWGRAIKIERYGTDPTLVREILDLEGIAHGFGNTEQPPGLYAMGELLAELMELTTIAQVDVDPVARQLLDSQLPVGQRKKDLAEELEG